MDFQALLDAAARERSLRRGSTADAELRRIGARRVRRGVYCTDPCTRPSYEESVTAALLVLPMGSVARGLTAARLWRLDGLVPVSAEEPLEFSVPGRANSIRLAGCRLSFDGTTSFAAPLGLPATTRGRTVIDLVPRMTFGDGVALVEAAFRGDPDIASELADERRRRLPRRGGMSVQRVLDFASPLSESVLESHARVIWAEFGLHPPVQQAVIRLDGRFVARVDFLWPLARLVVEVDGLAKYDAPGALQDEKARQNRLIAAGYTVLRFTWQDIRTRPDAVARQVSTALARAGA